MQSLWEKSVMVVANLIISSQCADPGIDLSLKAKGMLTLTIHMLPTNLLVVSKIRIRIKVKIDPVIISMKWTIRTILSLTMNKTQSPWCSTHSSGTGMWCLMKYPLNLHYNELSQTCMFQMVQMERHFVSKWTLVHVVIYCCTFSTNRLQDVRFIWTIYVIPLITPWILLPITTRKSSNWVHVLCMSLMAQTQEWWNFLYLILG